MNKQAKQVEDAVVVEDVAAEEPKQEVLDFKEFLYKELDTWDKIFKQFRKQVEDSPNHVFTEALTRTQDLIKACDREVVYMERIAQVKQQQADEALKAAPKEAQSA